VPFLAVSCALQVVYTVLVAKTYQVSDMSQTYPLMRGTAPLLVAIISVIFLATIFPRWRGWASASSVWRFWRWLLTAAPVRARVSYWR
jgi:hypothetical protein